jgi:hypothetical protein
MHRRCLQLLLPPLLLQAVLYAIETGRSCCALKV